MRKKLQKVFPEESAFLLESAETFASPLSREDLEHFPYQDDPVPEPASVEEGARAWALNYRSGRLRDRMAYIARVAGFEPRPIPNLPYGLFIAPGNNVGEEPKRLGDVLFPITSAFGLRPHTVVLFGSSYRRPFTYHLMEFFLKRCEEKFRLRFLLDSENRNRQHYFYFGYPTLCNDLYIDGRVYRSARFVSDDNAVWYEDYGAILHGPAEILVDQSEREGPFPNDAKTVVVIAGSHRLATGAGARLTEDAELRRRILGEDHQLRGWGALAYRIVVRSGEFSTVEDFSLIRRWGGSSKRVPDGGASPWFG